MIGDYGNINNRNNLKKKQIFTLYDDDSATLLSSIGNVISTNNPEKLINEYQVLHKINHDIVTDDFDQIVFENPIDYRGFLEKWNILNDIAAIYKMYFEGNSNRHSKTYHDLFCCSTSVEVLSVKIRIPIKTLQSIKKVFKNQDRLPDRLLEGNKSCN